MITPKAAAELSRISASADELPSRPNLFLMTNTLETGGSERQFVTLVRALSREVFNPCCGCLKKVGPFVTEVPEAAEFDLGGSFFSLQAQLARLRLGHQLRRNKVAIAHSFDFYSNLMLIPTAKLAGVPVVIGSQRQLGDLLSHRQSAAQTWAFRWCDQIVCNSHAAAAGLIARNISERKITVIPNALLTGAFASVPPIVALRPGVIRVGMVARMNHAVKNHAGLLRVAAQLAAEYSNVEYILAGDGPLRTSLETMAEELGLRNSVRFLGDCRDVPAVLASIDISVLPSLSESLSNTILESMAAGKPVVAYGVGGNPELIQDGQTGLLVNMDDQDGLFRALKLLLSSPSLREGLGLKARAFTMEHFTVEKVRARYEDLYFTLLAEKGQGRGAGGRTGKAVANAVRVGIVAPTMRYVGGQAVQAKLLVDHWKQDGRVHARLIPIDPPFPRILRWCAKIPFVRTLVRTPLYLAVLWRGMKDTDVAHIFSASYWSFLLAPAPAWLVARLRGKKVLINYHSGEARDHLQKWRTARTILRRADRLIVPSEYLVKVFSGFGLVAEAVPNSVDFRQFRYCPRRPLRPRLICTRGFDPYYRADLVVRSFARIKKEFSAAQLCLAGKGALEKKVREYVRAENLGGVEFTGSVSREEIHRYYDRADIFINASCVDNMPISILEAFASGTPVVSTAPEGIRYLVEHERTGLLCEPGDWQGLAENVIRLIREPELALKLGENAFENSQRFRWDIVREQWLEVYRSLRATSCKESEQMREAVQQEDLRRARAFGATAKSEQETSEGCHVSRGNAI